MSESNSSAIPTITTTGTTTAATSTSTSTWSPSQRDAHATPNAPDTNTAAAASHALSEEEDATTSKYSSNLQMTSRSHSVSDMRYGKCKWFNVAKGWGFITPSDGGQEVFVHQSVIQMSGFRSLGEQEEVEFECKQTERGLEATRVSGRQGLDCHGSTFRPRVKRRFRRVRCYNCGEFANHIASKCEQGPQPKRCHMCKQEDHLFADCPMKKQSSTHIPLIQQPRES